MPANAGVQDVGPSLLGAPRQRQRLVAGHAAFDQVERRDAVDDGKVRPHRLAHRLDDVEWVKRMRPSKSPPKASLRWLVQGAVNSLIR
jgi:hypothetical protein